ncbi:MAG: nucleoid-associated protein [Saprospiraceae bacterium]|nr:nucleoid-associated protein [Saprospiraceae bacterium]
MINRIEAELRGLCIHQVGNSAEEEGIKLSNTIISPEEEVLNDLLLKYFFDGFKDPEFFHFTFTSNEIELNPLYNFVGNIFDDPSLLLEESVKITRHLYEKSSHPNIKSGDLVVSYIENVLIDDELVNAVAIFKSENKDTFLRLETDGSNYAIDFENGINVEKLDKACLIFDTERSNGFKLCIIDKSNRNKEALYWREDFLNVASRKDNYHATTQYISLTKTYVKERLKHEDSASKIDEADIMHRSKEYLTNVETFDRSEFEDQVFKSEKLKTSFQEFSDDFEAERQIKLPDSFEVSAYAVKKKSKTFRSVIKLDKNFHIYVHGDRSKIERIQDIDGSKYYKIYFDQES